LQGPRSLDALKSLAGPGVAGLGYYNFGYFDVLGEKIIISRTGYTGELGYELYISAGKAEELWKRLITDSRVKPAGLGARDTLRLEMAYPLYGQDITADTTPLEADKGKFVDLKKDFIGKPALLKNSRPSRKLINFIAGSRRSPRHNYRISVNGRDAGVVTSGSFSPSLSCGIGMGYVDLPCAPGSRITLKENGVEIEAIVTEGPFYKKGTAKISEDSHARTG
ncbi:MAG: glycine cleavage T C-terminal barrel domain-containing protein, partial [Candidatus Omnitrophota bacterium]